MLINLRFLAVEPGRNFSLQANLFCLLKLTQVGGGCNDTEEAHAGPPTILERTQQGMPVSWSWAAELGAGRCDEGLGGFMSEDWGEVAAVGDAVSLGFFLNILRDLPCLGVMRGSVRSMAREFEDTRKQEMALCVKGA